MPSVSSIDSLEKGGSNEDYLPRSQPDDNSLRCDTAYGLKITVFRKESWTRWFPKCDQRASEPIFRAPSETESIGESAGGLVERVSGEMTSRLFVREKRLEERSEKWGKGDKLLLIDKLPTPTCRTGPLPTMLLLYGM